MASPSCSSPAQVTLPSLKVKLVTSVLMLGSALFLDKSKSVQFYMIAAPTALQL